MQFLKLLYIILIFISLPVLAAEPDKTIILGGTIHGLRDFKQQDIQIGIGKALDEMLLPYGIKTKSIIYESKDALENAVKNHDIDYFFGTPLELLFIEEYVDKKYILSALIDNKDKMRLYLLVRNDSKINDLKSLANKSIDIPHWLMNDIGGIYLDTCLLDKGLTTIDRFFSNVQKSNNSNQSIINLFFKKNDAALVTESEFEIATKLNPQILTQLKVLQMSDYFPALVALGLKYSDAETSIKLMDASMSLNKSRKGKNILKLLHSTGFVVIDFNEMESVNALFNKYRQLKSLSN